MKIGILTHHQVYNEGAFLQAYAQAQHFGAEIIDLRDQRIDEYQKRLDCSGSWEKQIERLPLSNERLLVDDYDEAVDFLHGYDVIVVGADEVWKLKSGAYSKKFPNAYWLSPELECKKIAFGASANRLNTKKLNDETRSRMKELLTGFDFLGVRDQHTLQFLEELGLAADKVPDPTIALDFSEFEADRAPALPEKEAGHPVLAIRLNPKADNDPRLDPVFKEFREAGFQVVSISYPSKHADSHLDLNPFEWADAFKQFDFCITCSYHALIFSLKNNVPVLALEYSKVYKKTESKIKDLLRDTNLLGCLGEGDLSQQTKEIARDFSAAGIRDLEAKHEQALKKAKEILT